jgi:hypothetical protein
MELGLIDSDVFSVKKHGNEKDFTRFVASSSGAELVGRSFPMDGNFRDAFHRRECHDKTAKK